MRLSDAGIGAGVLLGAALVAACSTPLPGGDLGEQTAAPDAGAPPLRVARGCAPFRAITGIDSVSGAVRSIPRSDGGVLLVVDNAVANGADVPSLVLAVADGATVDDCLAMTAIAFGAPTSALDPPTLTPLSGVTVGAGSLLYYSDPSGAVGVATQDAADGRFRPTATRLWTSDRPPYGSVAVVNGGDVDVLGCRGARFLDADCFMARVPAASAGDETAYSYYIGGGRFSSRVDDAWPMTTGRASLDIAPVAGGARWVMAYVTPLGNKITMRSGLSPKGPWSAPIEVATCDLADADMFCGGVHLHPTIAAPPGSVVLSYAPATLTTGAGARRVAEPDKWWPRLVALALPPLP